MQLSTKRLYLNEISLEDLQQVHQLHSFPETDEFNTLGIPDTIKITESIINTWIEHQKGNPRFSYTFAIRHKETHDFIGLMALNLGKLNFRIAEVWYKTHPNHWRNGYTSEALNELLKFGFQNLALHRIEAGCAVENIASIKVLEKVGMLREGKKRKVLPIRGEWVDNYSYAILETDFEELHSLIINDSDLGGNRTRI